MSALTNHLWQSTVFALLVTMAGLALRNNQAKTRYWLWLAASVKFLIPFSLLVSMGTRVEAPAITPFLPAAAVEQITVSFTPVSMPVAATARPFWPTVLIALWFVGVVFLLVRWFRRWLVLRAAVRDATSLAIAAPIPVVSSRTTIEPGVFGVLRPVLLLPEGIAGRLSAEEFDAILAHELCHVRRGDNLTAAMHMVVEAIFWFHPLVWWIGAKLVEERERACDEEVLRLGKKPQAYAEGILNVCKFYLESPLPCAPGVTGADLKRRIEEIMTDRVSRKLTLARKLLLAAAGMAVVAAPVFIGILNARAQSPKLSFDVASIKPSDPDARRVGFAFTPGGGGINATNVSLKQLIAFAYTIECGKSCDAFISGGPGWIDSQRFDIAAKSTDPAEAGADAGIDKTVQERVRLKVQALLADRFQLVIRKDAKERPVYALVQARGGHKLMESKSDPKAGSKGQSTIGGQRGQMTSENVGMQIFATALVGMVGRPVIDRTGLTGRYDFKLEYALDAAGGGDKAGAPDVSSFSGPSIFTALQEQLGLRLEDTKAPVETIVIERAERPSAN